jgi:hypothetical protein
MGVRKYYVERGDVHARQMGGAWGVYNYIGTTTRLPDCPYAQVLSVVLIRPVNPISSA